MAQPSSDSSPFSIVGIGASAGGIEALQVFFEALPEQLGVAFVVVVHLDPEHRSDLAPILARWTRLPVEEVSGTVPLKADHVYVIPPNRRLQITDTEVGAFPFEQPQGQRAPLDLFFRSLAEQHGDGFAVILSGGGSDGAVGVKAVKAQGGLILVQDPKEAAFDGMPRAAIATGVADLVLPVRDLAYRLVELIRCRQRVNQVLEGARPLRGEDEATLGRVLAHLHAREEMPREARPYAESIVDTVREPLIVLTPQLRVKSANQAFYTFFQVKPEETEGRLIYELGNRQWDIPKLRQLLEGVLLQNEVFDDFVVTHDFEQLGLRTLLLNARRLDAVQLILLAIEDITERKRIEEALCRSEEFHRLAVEAGHVGTWDVDLEAGDCCISSQMADLMGYARDQQALPPLQWQQVVPRTQWMASVHPQDRPAMEAAIAAAIKQEGLFELEFRIQLADGTSRWLYSKGGVTRDASGKLRLRGASINITERKQAEEALRQSEEHYRLLVESAREYAIFMLDLNGRIASWSSGAERLFGYTEAEAVGRSCADIFTEEDRAAGVPEQELAKAAEMGQASDDCWHVRKDGSRFWASGVMEALRQPDGRLRGFTKLLRDNTERKAAEDQLRQLNKTLGEQTRQLQEQDRYKNEFLGLLGHELRNPLAAISATVDLLRLETLPPDEHRQRVGLIHHQVQHLLRLVDDLLNITRISRGQIELKKVPLNLADSIANTVDLVRSQIEARRHRLELDLPKQPLWVEADPERLIQIMANLMSNAAHYTPEGGRITLTVQRAEDQTLVQVRDTGIGIVPEQLGQLFEPFSRLKPAVAHHQAGLGLGLALARRLAELHGGSLDAYSAGPGQGSEFTLRLPALPEEQPLAPAPPPPEAGARIPARRILLVEDEEAVADALSILLRHLGHTVQAVSRGEQAPAAVREFGPELVLLDIGLPDVSGYEVARRLRQEFGAQTFRLMALTGYGQDQDLQQTKAAGFDRYLLKPVRLEALQSVLREL